MRKKSKSPTPSSSLKNENQSVVKTLPTHQVSTENHPDLRKRLQQLPHCPGVYHMLDKNKTVLYIGKAKSLKNRVRQYFRNTTGQSHRIAIMVAQVVHLEWQITANEDEALVLENSHIKSLQPKFNILFRDDKSYPYLRFSNHSFPRVSMYRGRSRRHENCFGPYPHILAIRESLNLLQKVFRLRTCSDSVFNYRTRPCLLYQIHRCSAPCVGIISQEEYQKKVLLSIKYIQGLQPEVFEELDQAMQQAAQAQQYERAAELRDQLQALRITASSQRIIGHTDDHCDLIACVIKEGWFSLAFRRIHAGEPIEERTITLPNPHHAQPAEIIAEFLRDYYAHRTVPKKIWVSHSCASNLIVDEWLQNLPMSHPRQQREKEWLQRLTNQANIALESERNTQAQANDGLKRLQDWLQLPTYPKRIECVDISHLSGESTVASWVVFSEGRAHSSEYRRYNMRMMGGDDYAAIRELIYRRYSALLAPKNKTTAKTNHQAPIHALEHESLLPCDTTQTTSLKKEIPLPDLLVIDGGAGQLSSALSVINQAIDARLFDIPVIGLAKGPTRKEGEERIILADGQVLHGTLADQGFRILLAIRDEAHRFALTGQRIQRKKKNHSQLEELTGIGATRRRRLIARFGSLAGVKTATLEQLQQVEGISKMLASKIKESL